MGGWGCWWLKEFEAEKFFDFFEEQIVIVVGEFAVGRQLFELEFAFLSAGAVVFLVGDGFPGETGKGVDQAGEFFGGGIGIGRSDGEAGELVEHLSGGDAQAGFVEIDGVGRGQDVRGELGPGGKLIEPFALLDPVVVAALLPFGKITGGEIFALLAEAQPDVRI